MEVLFHGHWHDGGKASAADDLDKRDTAAELLMQTKTEKNITIPQATLFILWVVACVMLVIRTFYSRRKAASTVQVEIEDVCDAQNRVNSLHSDNEDEDEKDLDNEKKVVRKLVNSDNDDPPRLNEISVEPHDNRELNGAVKNIDLMENMKLGNERSDQSANKSETTSSKGAQGNFSQVKVPPSFDKFLFYTACLGAILMYFFVCDYLREWPAGERVYNRDLFLFLCLLLILVAAGFTIRKCPDKILNRDQTEEWKGWMQIMFVWYHYFRAAETYNLVRVYIACYVWMTGFGNFSFFWVRKDFSLWRMMKMLFRLNFLVILVVIVTNNSYMLYYICAMHTYWFISVYLFMAVFQSWNENRVRMAIKFAAYFICNAVIFDTKLLDYVFKPFWFILSYEGSLHEWEFRAGLDHYACFVGMLCAYNYPNYERYVNYLDKRHIDRRDKMLSIFIKAFTIGILLLFTMIWYLELMRREKYSYNSLHPYTSWFPILTYIILRNMFSTLRTHYLYFFTFLGKITLETYISQLHIYLQSNAKELIVYIPDYPLLNFALATAIYLFISYWLFEITTVFSAFLLPQSMKQVGINIVIGVVVCSLAACLAFLLQEASVI